MSAAAEETELKGGHPPAVKAGGMRVARNRQSSTGEKTEMTKEEQEEYGSSPPKADNKQVLVSGAIVKEEKAFTPEAVKNYHERPLPSKEMRPVQHRHNINQPK